MNACGETGAGDSEGGGAGVSNSARMSEEKVLSSFYWPQTSYPCLVLECRLCVLAFDTLRQWCVWSNCLNA